MLVCGVDEVGRGCLAGPVVAAAVVFGDFVTDGLRDSKKLSATQRTHLAVRIREECLAYAIGIASVNEINDHNILHATYYAMQRAVSGIVICPDEVCVDGNSHPDFPYPARAIVGGDTTIPEIMAAAIIAKVYRDTYMEELDQQLPQYGFAQHKGYPTQQHRTALNKHGASSHHRRHFAPVRHSLAIKTPHHDILGTEEG